MAMMQDVKPTEYKGEAFVWEKLSDYLPSDVIVYNHREIIDGREFDFALLIKGLGILVIEVKGWQAKYIFDVKSPDEIIMQDEPKPIKSPEKQARGYRFDWLNFVQDQFGLSPVVLSAVCYPFISRQEYKKCRLDIVSSEEFTLFSDDFVNANRLGQKINNIFIKKKPLNSTPMDDVAISTIRQYFEPSFKVQDTDVASVMDQYSLLKIYGQSLSEAECQDLSDMFFAGTKLILFVKSREDIQLLCDGLSNGLSERNIVADSGNLRLAEAADSECRFVCSGRSFRIFNFEVYLQAREHSGQDIIVSEGQMDESTEKAIRSYIDATGFNYEQYRVEHATVDRDILVQAGAGTGKTYSMVSRIAFLCNKRHLPINNLVDEIAMVTFTNEAADNMKARLKKYFMNCYILTRKKRMLHQVEAVDLMQISTIHKFAKTVIQSASMSFGLGCDFSIASGKYAKEQIYDKYLDAFLVKRQEKDPFFAQQLQMPVHRFRKLLMQFTGQLFNKSCSVKNLEPQDLGTFSEWPFFNEVITEVMIPAEKEYEQSVMSKNKIDLQESMILLNEVVSGAFSRKCDLRFKYLFVDEFQDTDDIQIDSFLKLQGILKDVCLFVVGDLKQSIYRFRGATISAFELVKGKKQDWLEFTLTTNYRTDSRLLSYYDSIFTKMGFRKFLPFERGKDTLTSSIDAHLPQHDLVTKIVFNGDAERLDLLFDEIDRQKAEIEYLSRHYNLSSEERTIAILMRNNWQIHDVLESAKNRGVYIETEVGGDLYQLVPTLDLYKLVLALQNPAEPVYLYNFICCNYVNISVDIQALHGMEKANQIVCLTHILNEYFIQVLGRSWDAIVKDTRILPVLMLLRNIYETAAPWQNYDASELGQRFYKANYELVLEKIIKMYSVDYLTLNVISNNLHINILAQQEEMARNVTVESEDIRVICTTVHKAKGLEYGTVILPYMSSDISSMRKADLDVYIDDGKLAYGIKIGKSPDKKYNSNYDVSQEQKERINEESRVLYVALTRAIRNVVWFADQNAKSKISWQQLMEV